MSDLFGNHIVGFSTRRLICFSPVTSTTLWKHYFKLKTGVFKGYADGMRNMHIEMDKILKLLGIDDEEEEGCKYGMRK